MSVSFTKQLPHFLSHWHAEILIERVLSPLCKWKQKTIAAQARSGDLYGCLMIKFITVYLSLLFIDFTLPEPSKLFFSCPWNSAHHPFHSKDMHIMLVCDSSLSNSSMIQV